MAIDSFDKIGGVSTTPSMVAVISAKGWRMSGALTPGRWPSSDGLVKLCSSDINPYSRSGVTRVPPYSLYSFKGYKHFYRVYPDNFIQNEKGRPDNYKEYHSMLDDTVDDTAFIEVEFPARGEEKYFTFSFLPKSYSIGGRAQVENISANWFSASLTSDYERITVKALENTTSQTRKGYVNIHYSSANGHVDADRKFAFYISQKSYTGTDPGDPGRPDVPYKDFKVYYDERHLTQNGVNTGTNPLIINDIGTFVLTVGGEDTLRTLTVNSEENGEPGIKVDKCEKYTKNESTGAVGIIQLTVENNCQNSKLEFTVANSRSSFKYYIGYIKQ